MKLLIKNIQRVSVPVLSKDRLFGSIHTKIRENTYWEDKFVETPSAPIMFKCFNVSMISVHTQCHTFPALQLVDMIVTHSLKVPTSQITMKEFARWIKCNPSEMFLTGLNFFNLYYDFTQLSMEPYLGKIAKIYFFCTN